MTSLEDQRAELVIMPPARLRSAWRDTFKTHTPDIGPDLLRRGFANRLQERVHGNLTGATLDRTNWKIRRKEINLLVLAVATRRYRVPLIWTVLGKAGNSNTNERIALMRRYLDLFGAGSIK